MSTYEMPTKTELKLSPQLKELHQQWKTNIQEILDFIEKQCLPIIEKENERIRWLDPKKSYIETLTPYFLTIPSVIATVNRVEQTSPQLRQFEEKFANLSTEENKEFIASILMEIAGRRAEISLHYVQLNIIITEYLLRYALLSRQDRQNIDSEIKISPLEARLTAYKHSIEGWELLQHYRRIFPEVLWESFTQRFTEHHLQLHKFYKDRNKVYLENSVESLVIEELNTARKTSDLALTHENYEKVISSLKHDNIIFHVRWEQTLALWHHFLGMASDKILAPARLDILMSTLGDITNNVGALGQYLIHTGITEIKKAYVPLLIADLTAMLYFLGGFYNKHKILSLSFNQRELLLNSMETINEMIDRVITGSHAHFKRQVLIQLDMLVANRFILNQERAQETLKLQQQNEIAAYHQKVNEDYEQQFMTLLASFPASKKKKSLPEVIDDETDEDIDEEVEIDKGIEDKPWLKKHTVIFADSPTENKPQHFLNLSSLARSLEEEQRNGNTIEVIRLHFAIADFYRLRALKILNKNAHELSLARVDFNLAYTGLNCALHEINQLGLLQDTEKQAELTCIQSWAKQIINEIDHMLSNASKKLDNKLKLLKENRDQVKSYIINKYGREAWFKPEQFDWNKLSAKAQKQLRLSEEMKTLYEMKNNFEAIKKRFDLQNQSQITNTSEQPAALTTTQKIPAKPEPKPKPRPKPKPKPSRSKFFKESDAATDKTNCNSTPEKITLGDYIDPKEVIKLS